ncbi:MAG: alanine dehydrogenase [Phycisphaerae bacterium]|nr:alanine dehydrogenase [Phycisphaerae bacterium]
MIVGVVKETKSDEYRVGVTPVGIELLRAAGHQVLVETQAGLGSGLTDNDYAENGAEIVPKPADVWSRADMIVKVKEPQPAEWPLLRKGQVVFTYWHFAADKALFEAILASGVVAVAYETIHDRDGHLPLLTPMSEIAGKMSIQEGAKYLERPMLGRGILLGGVPGVEPGNVVIIGGGIVGTNAAKVAAGLDTRVTIMDVNINRLRYLDDIMPANVHTIYSDVHTIRKYVQQADLVIGAVLIPGARCPVLVPESLVKQMKPGAVVVDVGIDQGGCIETSKPTTHREPTYVLHDVVHYGVTNMPGAVGRTSTFALTNATLPYVLKLANEGYRQAAQKDPGIAEGCNIDAGRVTNKAVADTFNLECHPIGG